MQTKLSQCWTNICEIAGGVVLALILVLNNGCATAQSRFESARAIDTIAAYESFLSTSPEGELANAARDRIEQLRMANLAMNVVSTALTTEAQPIPASELEFQVVMQGPRTAGLDAQPPKVKMMVPPEHFSALIVELVVQNHGKESVSVSSSDVVLVDASGKEYQGMLRTVMKDGTPLWWFPQLPLSYKLSPSGKCSIRLLFLVPSSTLKALHIRFGSHGTQEPLSIQE